MIDVTNLTANTSQQFSLNLECQPYARRGWSAKFDYQPYQSGGHKGIGGLRIRVGVQSNPAATTSPPQGKGIRRAGLHLSGCFSGIVTVPNTSASQVPT